MKKILRMLYYFDSFKKFKSYGKNIMLSKGGKFVRPQEIVLGSNIFINRNFYISARTLTLGNNIMIGPNVVIECDDHSFKNIGKTMFEMQNDRDISFVTIEDDVWIGANVTILKNVMIGEGSIIGAGCVVTKNVPPYTINVGIPNRSVKTRFTEVELRKHLEIVGSKKSVSEIIDQWHQQIK